MDETLGKRIAGNRKHLGITQDRLAEQLGVTAQAVSKWENDQSCPDIATLPKLAEIFGISVDALLGLVQEEPQTALEAKIDIEEPDSEPGHKWELRWDAGRKSSIGLAIWVILTAGWMFLANFYHITPSFWDLLWTNGLIVFGIFGLFPKFSFFRLGCALFGTYFLMDKLNAIPAYLGRELLLPAFLLLFGLSLLVDALRKPHRPHFTIKHNGKPVKNSTGSYHADGDSFDCDCSFCERIQVIDLPVLRRGDADVSFGHLTLDLSGVEEFVPGCKIDADCSFGELTVLIPRHIRAEIDSDTSFGSVDITGSHDPEAAALVTIGADVSFGQINIEYI